MKNTFFLASGLVALGVLVNIFAYGQIWLHTQAGAEIYFLNVGQGDATVLKLPGRGREARMLIDAGPDRKVLGELLKTLPFMSKRIDLAIATHAEQDHIGGMSYVFDEFRVGAFASNGAAGTGAAFARLIKTFEKNKTKTIILKRGDVIKYGESRIVVVGANKEDRNLNEGSLVLLAETGGTRALLTGDIGERTEANLIRSGAMLAADILKVGHHGSKYSTSKEWLEAVSPEVGVIGVGKNSYGHPTKEVLERLAANGTMVFRTDQDGTVKIEVGMGNLKVYLRR